MPSFRCHLLLALLSFLIPLSGAAETGEKPLIEAVFHDQTETALALIAGGADPKAANAYGFTPLSLACQNGNTRLVDALLEAGADPNVELPGGESALMTAARTGKPAPVKSLLAHGARVDARDRKQQTSLMWAAAEGHAAVVEVLLDAGADPKKALKSGFTPLRFAARNGHTEVVVVLLEAGVDVNAVSQNDKAVGKGPPKGSSALRLAVENAHYDLALQLLKAGADPDDQRSGYAPLHILTWVRKPNRGDGDDGLPPPQGSGNLTSLQFARALVEDFGGNVNLRLGEGANGGNRFGTRSATPFLLSAKKADLPYLKLLHDLGADPTLTLGDGTTPLLATAGVGSSAPEEEAGTETERLETLAWFRELALPINTVNKNGETALHGAAYKNVPKVAEWLDEQGADVEIWNQKNKRNWTPLLIAQGFRPGNFKPDAATINAIEKIMRARGIEPPPAPKRPVVGKPKKYEP